MTKLTDLDATFVRLAAPDGSFDEVASKAEANGVLFDCPKCGRHSVLCWDRSIPQPIEPGPGRWEMTGTDLSDLTLTPSVDLSRSETICDWHGWVKNGDAA
jgi:uncharacterized protein DUF6527